MSFTSAGEILCAPYLSAKYQAYNQWGQGQAMPDDDNDLGAEFDDLIRARFLLGSPDEVAEQMLALHRATGVNHLIMSVQWPGMPQSLVLGARHARRGGLPAGPPGLSTLLI